MIVAYHSGHRAYDSEVRPFFSSVEIFFKFYGNLEKNCRKQIRIFFCNFNFYKCYEGKSVKSHFFRTGGSCV